MNKVLFHFVRTGGYVFMGEKWCIEFVSLFAGASSSSLTISECEKYSK